MMLSSSVSASACFVASCCALFVLICLRVLSSVPISAPGSAFHFPWSVNWSSSFACFVLQSGLVRRFRHSCVACRDLWFVLRVSLFFIRVPLFVFHSSRVVVRLSCSVVQLSFVGVRFSCCVRRPSMFVLPRVVFRMSCFVLCVSFFVSRHPVF